MNREVNFKIGRRKMEVENIERLNHSKLLAKTGKLSLEQMFEVIKLSKNGGRIVQAIVEEIDWDQLLTKQIFKAIKLSNNDTNIIRAAVETGRLSSKQMFKAIKLSNDDSDVIQAVVKILRKQQ
jgi:hypothetical protein